MIRTDRKGTLTLTYRFTCAANGTPGGTPVPNGGNGPGSAQPSSNNNGSNGGNMLPKADASEGMDFQQAGAASGGDGVSVSVRKTSLYNCRAA